MKCQSWQIIKSSFNKSNILILPLEKVRKYKNLKYKEGFIAITLEDYFDYYQVEELLNGKNQI